MSQRILAITGMHRSGTSWAASLASTLQFNLGERLYPADSNNPLGYFEDMDLLELSRMILHTSVEPGATGHADWGWSESESLDRSGWSGFEPQARVLVQARAVIPSWGWKDPRVSLLLDFWGGILPDAHYILVYRFPWQVADSMQHLGAEIFLRNPHYASRIWRFYNQHLLNFYHRHADRCLLLNTNALIRQPNYLVRLLRSKFDWEMPEVELDNLFVQTAFHEHAPDNPLIHLYASLEPDCIQLLTELDHSADLSGQALWQIQVPQSYQDPDTPCAPDQTPRLSVVIPCYNQGDFIADAIASVRCHAPSDCEIIIVNDGSTQARTLTILATLKKLGYFVLDQPNAGLSAARNAGIRRAHGKYILPLDADDRLRENFLEPAIQILNTHSQIGVVYTDWQEFGMRSECHRVPPFDLQDLAFQNQIDACSVLRKQVWIDCGGYDSTLTALEDWDLWINAFKRGWEFWHLPVVGHEIRVRPDSMLAQMELPTHERLYRYIVKKHNVLSPVRMVERFFESRAKMAEQTQEIAALVAQVVERQGAVDTLAIQLEQQTNKLNALVAQVVERQETVESLAAQLEQQTNKVNTLVDQVVERQRAVESLTAQLAAQTDKVDRLVEQVVERQRTVETLALQLAEKERLVQSLSSNQKSKDQALEA